MWDRYSIAAVYAAFFLYCVFAGRRRHAAAREAAEWWLTRHGYRVHPNARQPWLASSPFGSRWWQNSEDALEFRFVVDDRKLGGTGVVWLRVWPEPGGGVTAEPEVAWERMPNPARDPAGPLPPAGQSWEAAQLALLARIARGESTFRPDDLRTPEAGERFDHLVEHLLAMQRRGLVTCATPLAELRLPPRQYAALTDVALTDEGRRVAALNAGR